MKRHQHLLFLLLFLMCFIALFIFDDVRNLLFIHTKFDTIGHIIGFFCLTWLLHSLLKFPLFKIGICLIFYGALSELGQYYLGFRNGDFRGFIADIIGILFFVLLKCLNVVYSNTFYDKTALNKKDGDSKL